ncbi:MULTISPECIES: hypothetical protein [unclassified Cryobacterium]|uniref:hypothetical protein n=1 Tax=unclassified Cryobacterium TaxID=2649013 RepID=UPI00141B6E09|nr:MULTISPECIES: hypothetical protein [unclassified Cryobacterium]
MKLQKMAVLGSVLVIAIGLGGLSLAVITQADLLRDQGSTIRNQGDTIQDLASNYDALYTQVSDSGAVPVAPPADVVVDAAPLSYTQGQRGFTGDTGASGRQPTSEEVAASVASYCLIHLDCSGAKGDQGAIGPVAPPLIPVDGRDGQAGATGATGAVGATGADSTVPGPIGPPGVGIASVTCHTDGYWFFTLTDDSTQTVAGPCRVDEITTTPTPTQGATP